MQLLLPDMMAMTSPCYYREKERTLCPPGRQYATTGLSNFLHWQLTTLC